MISNKLKDRLKERKKENSISLINEQDIDTSFLLNISQDKEILDILKNETINLINVQIKSSIELGKIFTTVFNKLANARSSEGIYEKWITYNGFNKRTALRHRKRYELYSLVNDDKKNFVSLLPIKFIEQIFNNDKNIYISLINEGITKEELNTLLHPLEISSNSLKEESPIDYDINIFKFLDEKLNQLNNKDKIKVEKLMSEIYKIINKI